MAEPAGAGAGEVQIPAKALSINGEAPAQGDSVSFTVEGKVTRAEGESVFVMPESVNGEPISGPAPVAADPDAEMEAAAMTADKEEFGGY